MGVTSLSLRFFVENGSLDRSLVLHKSQSLANAARWSNDFAAFIPNRHR